MGRVARFSRASARFRISRAYAVFLCLDARRGCAIATLQTGAIPDIFPSCRWPEGLREGDTVLFDL